jgi:hypothetical protein
MRKQEKRDERREPETVLSDIDKANELKGTLHWSMLKCVERVSVKL